MKIVKNRSPLPVAGVRRRPLDRHRHAAQDGATEPAPKPAPAADAAAPDPGANPPLTLNRYLVTGRATSARSPSLAPPSMFRS